jgi:hypothetical protein
MTTPILNFTSAETWFGGYYEIEFELGVPSDERLALALQTVWSHPSLEGCYLSRDLEPHTQVRISPRERATEGHLYGVANLPNGSKAACGTYVCRLQNEAGIPARDLLTFYVPLGALAGTYAVGGYPFSNADQVATWRLPLDEWLVELGRSVYKRVPFPLALIGFEVDFPEVSAKDLQQNGVPAKRYDGYLWEVGGRLEWYPPTNWDLVRFPDGDAPAEHRSTPPSNPRT